MRIKAKSILVGRKSAYSDRLDVRPCFISFFNNNDPHKSGETPFKVIDVEDIHRVNLIGLNLKYLLPGNDIVANDLEYVDIDINKPHVTITGKHKE